MQGELRDVRDRRREKVEWWKRWRLEMSRRGWKNKNPKTIEAFKAPCSEWGTKGKSDERYRHGNCVQWMLHVERRTGLRNLLWFCPWDRHYFLSDRFLRDEICAGKLFPLLIWGEWYKVPIAVDRVGNSVDNQDIRAGWKCCEKPCEMLGCGFNWLFFTDGCGSSGWN